MNTVYSSEQHSLPFDLISNVPDAETTCLQDLFPNIQHILLGCVSSVGSIRSGTILFVAPTSEDAHKEHYVWGSFGKIDHEGTPRALFLCQSILFDYMICNSQITCIDDVPDFSFLTGAYKALQKR